MLDEKLHNLIKKYRIYDAIGREPSLSHSRARGGLEFKIRMLYGLFRLVVPLNKVLGKIQGENIAFCGNIGKIASILWYLILPKNRNKVQFFVTKKKDEQTAFFGRTIVEMHEVALHPIQVVIMLSFDLGWHADLLAYHFEGSVIELRSLVCKNHLESFFGEVCGENPYAEIYISRKYRDMMQDGVQKQFWHKKLIAHCIRARDFLSAKKEIELYEKSNYEDAENYHAFWNELETFFEYIKERLSHRKEQDVFVFWLDQMEKKEFFDLQWIGHSLKGRVFQRAYTTMVNTKAILYSILLGKNVKSGHVMSLAKPGLQDSVFHDCLHENEKIIMFSKNFYPKLQANFLHECGRNYWPDNDAPSMVWMWNALDTLLESKERYVMLFHCMETHCFYPSAVTRAGECERHNSSREDYSKVAAKTRAYLDQQLEWYHEFFPSNAVCIYMSDHGSEFDLTELNINVPFKITGKDFPYGEENRIFSYKNLCGLIGSLLSSEERNIDRAFEEEAIIDVIDPYDKSFLENIKKGELWEHFSFERRYRSKNELKKYLQTTKVVTAEGEYYTINILGEETYYRDKECTINLIDDSAYSERIAELREKAGKFYNPWKEKQQVAIDFYEYLGIKEKDIVAQCY